MNERGKKREKEKRKEKKKRKKGGKGEHRVMPGPSAAIPLSPTKPCTHFPFVHLSSHISSQSQKGKKKRLIYQKEREAIKGGRRGADSPSRTPAATPPTPARAWGGLTLHTSRNL